MSDANHNNQRRYANLFLNRRFQIRYVIFVVTTVIAIATTLGWMIWLQSRRASEFAIAHMERIQDPQLQAWLHDSLASTDNKKPTGTSETRRQDTASFKIS